MPALLGFSEKARWNARGRNRRQALLKLLSLVFVFWIALRLCKYAAQKRNTIVPQDVMFAVDPNLPTPDRASKTAHYGSVTKASAQNLCSAHGWRPFPVQTHRRKVYDLFMINNELDWLEIRLHEMHQYVDYFVILESATTFTGLPKALTLKENWARFEKFHSQIIYHVLEDPPMDVHITWVHEDFQRNAMFQQVIPFLKNEQAANLGDVILVSDVDEIPRPAALELMRYCDFPRRLTLRSRFYYYGFQWLHRGPEWAHPQATTYQGPSRTILPADLRNGEGGNRFLNWFEKSDLFNAAWHCSSCFSTVDEMLNKMSSFSHTKLNQEKYRNRARIVDRVRKGLDLWDRKGEIYDRVEKNEDVPSLLKENTARFAYLLDRDSPTAGFQDVGPEKD
ncbi:glycosyltransferase family 17 protein [Coleophoma cylindrospora]|uniref:Glycosyltransferase family 17 protein n=1 Tax=Coleophoma cylindrospora TaxID=1849047 RepID=A0A3D8SDR6_9HELO|nr:glycosyltransferase family 17 protein [Coleophoma cylindrospora]